MKTTVEANDFSPSPNVQKMLTESSEHPNTEFIPKHMDSLLDAFEEHFDLPDPREFDWLRNPFSTEHPEKFSFQEKVSCY